MLTNKSPFSNTISLWNQSVTLADWTNKKTHAEYLGPSADELSAILPGPRRRHKHGARVHAIRGRGCSSSRIVRAPDRRRVFLQTARRRERIRERSGATGPRKLRARVFTNRAAHASPLVRSADHLFRQRPREIRDETDARRRDRTAPWTEIESNCSPT